MSLKFHYYDRKDCCFKHFFCHWATEKKQKQTETICDQPRIKREHVRRLELKRWANIEQN